MSEQNLRVPDDVSTAGAAWIEEQGLGEFDTPSFWLLANLVGRLLVARDKVARIEKILPVLEAEFPLMSSRRFRFLSAADVLRFVLEPNPSLEHLNEVVESALRGEPWVDHTEYDTR